MKVAVIGAGKLGTAIVEALLGGGNEITLIDTSEARISAASDQYDIFTVCADALQTEVLNSLPVSEYDLLVAATNDDEKNIVIAAFAKKLGCPLVVARARAPEHVNQIDFIKKSMGIDDILNPDMTCASEIFRFLTEKYSLSDGRFDAEGVSVLEFGIEKMPELQNNLLKDVSAALKELLIVAVSREGKIIIPTGSTNLLEGDMLYVIGASETIDKMAPKLIDRQTKTGIKRVMIAGGGNTGFFLAKKLSEYGIGVKLIEKDEKRCEYLSGVLNDVLILNGDASDPNLLQEENLGSMDAFVALTGFDEENLLLSLIAKDEGVTDIVTKISKKNYSHITQRLGVAMTINPMDMSGAAILHFIRPKGVVLLNRQINAQAEFIEIKAEDSMPLTKKSLLELDVPEGVIFAAAYRDGEVIIPRGNTKFLPGDRILILYLLSSSASLEGLFTETPASTL